MDGEVKEVTEFGGVGTALFGGFLSMMREEPFTLLFSLSLAGVAAALIFSGGGQLLCRFRRGQG